MHMSHKFYTMNSQRRITSQLLAKANSFYHQNIFQRSFATKLLPLAERRYRWWERAEDFASDTSRPRLNWWEQTDATTTNQQNSRREAIREQVKELRDFTVLRPPSRKLVMSANNESTMDSFVQPMLASAKSEKEKEYLQSFLGKPSKVGQEYFDIEKWTRFWGQMAEDYQQQRSKWNKSYKAQKDAKRKERIRVHQGVEGDIAKVFGKARARALWGKNFEQIKRKIKGFVLDKNGDRFSVLWAVPGNRFEMVAHENGSALETIYPQEYVPDFDEFIYTPSFEITPEIWLEQSLMEHPLLFITESKSDPAYVEATRLAKGSAFGTIDLSVSGVSESTKERVRNHLVSLTNWPTFPQIFVSSVFLGGIDNLKELSDNESLNTVLIMAGAKQKHIVDREADKYRDLIAELVSEWRYKRIDKVTKGIEALTSQESRSDEQSKELAALQKQLGRLQTNDRVEDMYFEELREKFLQDSALEIERLTLHKEASKVRYLLPEDDPRVTLEIIVKALEHRFFKSSLSRWRANMLLNRRTLTSESQINLNSEADEMDLQTDLEFNVTDGPTSTQVKTESQDVQPKLLEMTDEQARAFLESKEGSNSEEDEKKELLKLLRYINAEMVSKFGPMKRRVFYDHFMTCLNEAYNEDVNEVEEEEQQVQT